MKIAYVDHSFHRETDSNSFLVDLLKRHGHSVSVFWDEKWNGGKSVQFDAVRNYDVVIMFQTQCPARASSYSHIHKNVVYIPMLDQFSLYSAIAHDHHRELCKFRGCKVVSFSNGVHCAMMAFGIKSLLAKYYPHPSVMNSNFRSGLRAFFWVRCENQISWPMVRKLLGNTVFENVHIHIAPDPHTPAPTLPTDEEIAKYNITTSTWFENKDDFLRVLQKANVFFAPRLTEGIGQSFLEAMARGQCVVAPNRGTMNEYIVHGVNGILYEPEDVASLDFSRAFELGKNAYESVRAGRQQWEAAEKRIVEFILTPNSEFYLKRKLLPLSLQRAINLFRAYFPGR